jgi:hypothetical protein
MDNTTNSKQSIENIIGWREWVTLPELNVPKIKAKIDTGARTSVIHTKRIELYEKDDHKRVRFALQPSQTNSSIEILCDAEVLSERYVKNSGGFSQFRCVIKTEIILGKHKWSIELTLTNRDSMKFRMLLGRTAIRGRFLVDPGKSFVFGDE